MGALNMAKRKKKGGRKKRPIRIFATVGLVVGLIQMYRAFQEGGWGRLFISLTGYDANYGWNWKWATSSIPMLIGAGMSFAASKLGLNRYSPIKGVVW